MFPVIVEKRLKLSLHGLFQQATCAAAHEFAKCRLLVRLLNHAYRDP